MVRMLRGSVLIFRSYIYLRLILSSISRVAFPLTAAMLVLVALGFFFYLDSSLANAAQVEPITNIEVTFQETKPIEEFITKTKPKPRSRNTKSSSKIFAQSIEKELFSMPSASIEIVLPILMYHKTPADFEGQLRNLQAKGYTPITMRSASRIMRGLEASPSKPVVITYDDGFSDQLVAFELLKKYNMPATFYVMPGGELSGWCVGADRQNLKCGDSYMNWAEITMISDSGLIEIGSHTIDHAQLNALDGTSKRNQIFSAKQIIEQKINKQVVSFAYPYGAFDGETIELVREAGYTSAVSTIGGTKQSTNILFELRRIRNAFDLP